MVGELALEAWTPPWRALAALAAEAAVGYPAALHRRLPHPVVWAGGLISALERTSNRPHWPSWLRRTLGALALGVVAGTALVVGAVLQVWLARLAWGLPLFALVASLGLAQRSLYQHVAEVARPLVAGDLVAARAAVARIVGRDVAALDGDGVAAAALESLAESFNDGIVAPAFWLVVAGLPGLFVYKAVNTADSLIGHMEPRWRAFGWAAARTDDLMNLVPARLAGLLLTLAGQGGFRVMLRDAPRHASPNAGWPEAAMAGALRIRLGGPATYDGRAVERPVFGVGERPGGAALRRGLRLYLIGCGLLWALLALGSFAWPR
jgi:adenosylcobinamide-phosphate synthase